MKTAFLLAFIALVGAPAAWSQQAAGPLPAADATSTSLEPVAETTLQPEPLPDPSNVQPGSQLGEPTLIPNEINPAHAAESTGGPSPEAAFLKSKTGTAVSTMDERLRYRRAMTAALASPKLHELRAKADSAPTEQEKRALLRDYYQALYGAMLRSDPTLEKRVKAEKALSIGRLEQRRLRPLGSDAEVPGVR